MPNIIVAELMKKVAKLEAQVEALFTYQKWQMGLLSLILLASLGALFKR